MAFLAGVSRRGVLTVAEFDERRDLINRLPFHIPFLLRQRGQFGDGRTPRRLILVATHTHRGPRDTHPLARIRIRVARGTGDSRLGVGFVAEGQRLHRTFGSVSGPADPDNEREPPTQAHVLILSVCGALLNRRRSVRSLQSLQPIRSRRRLPGIEATKNLSSGLYFSTPDPAEHFGGKSDANQKYRWSSPLHIGGRTPPNSKRYESDRSNPRRACGGRGFCRAPVRSGLIRPRDVRKRSGRCLTSKPR